MTLDEELRLSYYKEIGIISKEHCVSLVQHSSTGIVYVKKRLYTYDAQVYRKLKQYPVKNTPVIVEAIEDNGVLTVIEEYISGRTLSNILEERRIPKPEGVRIIRDLCVIVGGLHSFSPPIIHRDIKPSNIMIMADGTVKLLDMDAAKVGARTAGKDTVLMGTAGYAAPEQYGFGSSGKATDIYAIGVVMAEIAHGSLDRNALTDSTWDRIVEKCTRIDPQSRFSSVSDLIRALDRLKEEELPVDVPEDPVLADNRHSGRRFAPPGFRSGNKKHMIIASIGYLLMAFIASVFYNEEYSADRLLLNKFFIFGFELIIVLMLYNYLDIWDTLGISRVKNPVGKATLMFFSILIACLLWITVLFIIESTVIQ